jgi:protein-disulfide isomerase
MNRLYHVSLVVLVALATVAAVPQTPRRRTTRRPAAKVAPPQPSPEAASRPQPPSESASKPLPPRQPQSPRPLAVVNGQTITTSDIDPGAMEEIRSIEERIAAAPRQILETQINTELLNVEARKRKLTSQQLHDLEVTKRITNPTEAEIQAFIDSNRAQLDGSDPATVRTEVVSWLRANREEKLSEDLVRRLRAANPVVMGVDMNTPNLNPSAVVATVAGKAITASTINERLKPVIYKLRLNAYEVQKAALDRTINDLLLIAEANKRNIAPEEIVRVEISEKAKTPTDADVAKFYADNKTRINGDFNSVRHQIAEYLLEEDRRRLEKALSERLRKSSDLRILISEPQRPVQLISTDDDPSRGEMNAPVTIVEFTDFQCPACAAMHPILEEVLKAYEGKVRFVVRDFPLNQHANARKAAEAANAANAQGKFFEYARLLFKHQNALDVPSLKKYATELGLDRKRFDADLDAGTFAAEVKHDIADGEMYGIDSTPTIFVNGIALRSLNAEGLRTAIDQALGNASPPQKPSQN